ncbi:MAG: methyltransferase domain-containing protein [Chloroflexi bacterium]|nr:methyltransferase domain-containing protein [Chloroflexota bacterium]
MAIHNFSARRQTPSVPRWHHDWLSVDALAKSIYNLSREMRGARILDIGCGNKPYRNFFSDSALYVGVDLVAINSAADARGAVTRLSFRAETFDGTICSQVLEHVPEPSALLREAHRVLKTKGQLLLSAPMYWHHHEDPFDFYRYTRYGLSHLIESAGFQIVQIVQQGGAWRVTGQVLANTLMRTISFRTFGLRALLFLFINSFFAFLDRVNYHSEDTCNFVALARKVEKGF